MLKSLIEKLRTKLKDNNLDALFVSQPENRYYLSGFSGTDGFLLITNEQLILLTDFRYVEQARLESPDYGLFQISGKLSIWLPLLMKKHQISRLGFEAVNLTYDLYQRMSEALIDNSLNTKMVATNGIVEELRLCKEPSEIEMIEKAAAITDATYDHILNILNPGMSERELAWEIEKYMRDHGASGIAFDTIVASGLNAALPHARPGDHVLNTGEPIVIDMGAKFGAYCSDFTRTICIGKPDEKYQNIYRLVLKAQQTAIESIKVGISGERADSIARSIITDAGYGENFGHSLGHGLGLFIHEGPRLGINSQDVLQNGMVFSIEPGIYLPGWGGVRIEDIGVLENNNLRIISKSEKPEYI